MRRLLHMNIAVRSPKDAVFSLGFAVGLSFAISFSAFLCSELLLQICPRLDFSLSNENP